MNSGAQVLPAPSAGPAALKPIQMAWLAGAIFVVSAGYGALLPLLPEWLTSIMQGASATEVARHVGFVSGVYAVGLLVGAPLWGLLADRLGGGRILLVGLIGYASSLLLLLVPGFTGLWGVYLLRGAAGLFVAAVVPVVAALVAEYTPEHQRARRFAWIGAMSLLGFLFGPGLSAIAAWLDSAIGSGALFSTRPAQVVLGLSAVLGGVMMLGLAWALPPSRAPGTGKKLDPGSAASDRPIALWGLIGVVMFVLAAFELGIVLQGRQSPDDFSRQASIMFAECSLVMLGVNALLFLTSLLEKISARVLIGTGLILAMIGLVILAVHRSDPWMYLGVSLTAAGTGLVLPVVAYIAAGAARLKLGAIMGGLAAASGFGQTIGSAAGGWLFGMLAQQAFFWLCLPLLFMLSLVLVRPGWWSVMSAARPMESVRSSGERSRGLAADPGSAPNEGTRA